VSITARVSSAGVRSLYPLRQLISHLLPTASENRVLALHWIVRRADQDGSDGCRFTVFSAFSPFFNRRFCLEEKRQCASWRPLTTKRTLLGAAVRQEEGSF
jgi:hypothetical protein